ncbi:MAG: hypothetical protein BWY82_00257 [Verrucomicrobia bacterium ADurb.Bin474]|nr:MAG: hypothetical protein BWY82_00257 [Verrucomicrobia bacterium ADurb.Bin474]
MRVEQIGYLFLNNGSRGRHHGWIEFRKRLPDSTSFGDNARHSESDIVSSFITQNLEGHSRHHPAFASGRILFHV